MTKYKDLLDVLLEFPQECFFAFDDTQFNEAIKERNLNIEDIKSCGNGLYGTIGGIKQFISNVKEKDKRISKECTPQEVYDYEFANHECGYVGDDREAFEIVLYYFDPVVALGVQRRNAY